MNEKNNIKDLLRSGNSDDVKLGALLAEKKGMLDEIRYECEDLELLEKKFNLPLVRAILTQFPMVHITGSVSLFLQGVRLSRWNQKHYTADIDMISPYYVNLQQLNFGDIAVGDDSEKQLPSGGDFTTSTHLYENSTTVLNGTITLQSNFIAKVDVGICPTERYRIVDYMGFKYRLGLLNNILSSKIKYASKPGGDKHKDDIWEMCGCKAWSSYYDKNKEFLSSTTITSTMASTIEQIELTF